MSGLNINKSKTRLKPSLTEQRKTRKPNNKNEEFKQDTQRESNNNDGKQHNEENPKGKNSGLKPNRKLNGKPTEGSGGKPNKPIRGKPKPKSKSEKPKQKRDKLNKGEPKLRKKVLTPEGEQLVDSLKSIIFGFFRQKEKVKPNRRTRAKPGININRKHEPEDINEDEQLYSEHNNNSLTDTIKPSQSIPSNIPTSKGKQRKFTYTRVARHGPRTEPQKDIVIEEIKDEKVLMKRAKLDTVRDINDVGFFAKIGLVSYFNQKESGKLDERLVREEYRRNTRALQTQNSLKYFLLESARRNLEYHEYPEITIQIDSRYQNELEECINSKLLASYDIRIEKQDEILSKMNVDPIIISMRLKRLN